MSTSRTVSRREFLKIAGLGAAGVTLGACAPVSQPPAAPATEAVAAEATTAPEAPPTAVVELALWQGWAGATGIAAMTAVENELNSEGAPYTIKMQTIEEGPLEEKLQTAIAAGTPPDIGVCCVSYSQFYARGSFIPLDDYIASSKVVKKEDFVSGLFDSMTWQGKVYGVPALECGPRFGFIYNKDLVAEAGLDAEKPPETWDEAYEWHKALTKKDQAGNVEVIGYDPRDATAGAGPWPNLPIFWGVTYGLDVWDENTGTFHFDDDRFVQALTTMKEFYDLVGVEQMAAFRTSYGGWTQSPSSSFPSGVQAALVTGYYAPGELNHSAPDLKFGVTWAPRPEARRAAHYQAVCGHPAYIPAGTEYADYSWDAIERITSDKIAQIMFDTTGWLGGRKKWYDATRSDIAKYPGLDWYLKSANEATELWAGTVIPVDGFVNQQRNMTYDAVVYGQKTPEQAAQDMQTACTQELAKQFPDLKFG
jgi:multiple sugar transport system substrate-binding protein